MSVENASRFIAKIQERNEETLALLSGGKVPEGIGVEDVAAITAAANAVGWDFTADELRECCLNLLWPLEAMLSSGIHAVKSPCHTYKTHEGKGFLHAWGIWFQRINLESA